MVAECEIQIWTRFCETNFAGKDSQNRDYYFLNFGKVFGFGFRRAGRVREGGMANFGFWRATGIIPHKMIKSFYEPHEV